MVPGWVPVLGGLHSAGVGEGGKGKGRSCPLPGSLRQEVLSLTPSSLWDLVAPQGAPPLRHRHPRSIPCLDSTAPLPRPYLPTAKTVRPMVRFCSRASCWATAGSKMPSQIMGAPQEVQVRTSGRALAGRGWRDRSIHPAVWCKFTAVSPVLGHRAPEMSVTQRLPLETPSLDPVHRIGRCRT